jgi:hypothetical protein
MQTIQLIDKQAFIFRFTINGIKADLHTRPIAMYANGLFPLKVKVKGKIVYWCDICYEGYLIEKENELVDQYEIVKEFLKLKGDSLPNMVYRLLGNIEKEDKWKEDFLIKIKEK